MKSWGFSRMRKQWIPCTRPLFPPPTWPGYEAMHTHITRTGREDMWSPAYSICVHRRTYSVQCSDKICFPQLCIKCGLAKSCPGIHTALQVPMVKISRILMPVVFSQYIVSFITYRLLVPVEIAETTTENFPALKLCTLHILVLRKQDTLVRIINTTFLALPIYCVSEPAVSLVCIKNTYV